MEVANLLVKKVFTSWILFPTELKDPEILNKTIGRNLDSDFRSLVKKHCWKVRLLYLSPGTLSVSLDIPAEPFLELVVGVEQGRHYEV